MLRSLLVANRGEIACRIFRTARALGVRCIAVFSDADATARHVRTADEAVRLGPAAARESYLSIERILAAARATGAAAIHPGYGFLSENAAFARACESAGIIFVGPPAASIAAMGSKILAKQRMAQAGVPVLPGYAGERQDLAHLEREALAAGLPLIIKPAAGGGGKGMHIVRSAAELAAALSAARRLAESAFGDGALLIERYLEAPRHIEVQVFADRHGHFLHLGERDCSIQRRHQKLIEECPAPGLPEALRARLRAAALVVAREVGYVGAGTVEFLLEGEQFYFMEMNTRLQVEHTVTEAVTGLDLVEWQLRVASGEALPLKQEEVRFSGHAIEARVCAEDPTHGFRPSAGRLELAAWPQGAQVRVDAGFDSGDKVPDSYDSLLGKVIVSASERSLAAAELARALDATRLAGVKTNERFLARILRGAEFLGLHHSIAFLDRAAAQFQGEPVSEAELALAALAVNRAGTARDPWGAVDGFIPNLPAQVPLHLKEGATTHAVTLEYQGGEPVRARVDAGAPLALHEVRREGDTVAATCAELRLSAHTHSGAGRVHLWSLAEHREFTLEDERTQEFAASAAEGGLTTPLPGVVVSVPVKLGEQVEAGTLLMVIEAMKMEHAISAPYAGEVTAIHYAQGERVSEGSALLELKRAL